MELLRLYCNTSFRTKNSHITSPQTTPASNRKLYFFANDSPCYASSTSPSVGKYFLYSISAKAMVILLSRYRLI